MIIYRKDNSMKKRNSNRTVYEDDIIRVSETNHDYDFVAYILNKTDIDIIMRMDEETAEENAIIPSFTIPANDWIGLVAWEYEGNKRQALSEGNYEIELATAS